MLDEIEKASPGGNRGEAFGDVSFATEHPSINPKTAPAQESLLQATIKALCAEEIRADTLENIPLMLAASGWRSAAALLTHAAGCADAGDLLNAERNRQIARELFIKGNDAFRQFMEARHAQALAEAYQ